MRFSCFNASRRARVLGPLLCTLAAAGCGSLEESDAPPDQDNLAEAQAPVVYGIDNRTDVYAHADATLRTRAQQSTVALMSPAMLNTTNPNNVTFNAFTLGTAQNLCTTERFRNDPAAASCSGTLIDDDLVLTAGHCVTSAADCSNARFVFRFDRTSATALETVTTADIFACQSIVTREERTVGGMVLDYAILRLDRAATPRFTPAPIRAGNGPMVTGQQVTVIGSGSGIPFKIDSGGSVRDARASASTLDYFVANTDTFAGNSGSGVYENSGYTVAGILVRGATDYVANGSCNVVNVCTETGCRGEDISYVRPAITAYCQVASCGRLCGHNTVAQQLYVGYFGRPADTGGLSNMSAQLKNANAPMTIPGLDAAYSSNATVKTLVDSFGTSAESNALYTGDTSSFVNAIYHNVLNRSADQEGLTYWTTAINNGTLTKSRAALSIMAGAMTNTTPQGLIDGATVGKKTAVASNFTIAIDTNAEVTAYQGSTAAAKARSMLATVTNTTDVNAFQPTVNSTLASIVAGQ
jgi:V8-like Glu-specific endopeptidase